MEHFNQESKETELSELMEQASSITLTTEQLTDVSELIKKQIELENTLARAEGLVGTIKEQLKVISEKELPDLMDECKMSSFVYEDFKVEVKPYYSAKITEENTEKALTWLDEHNHSDLIKNDITLTFKKGEDEQAAEAEDVLVENGFTPDRKMYVHHSTLKAFVKEQIEMNNPLPLDLFGVYIGKKSKIKAIRR